MSTDYYLGCSKCHEAYHIGQDGWKFFTFYSGEKLCMDGIGDFISRHINNEGCIITLIPDYKLESDSNEWSYVDWHNKQLAIVSEVK